MKRLSLIITLFLAGSTLYAQQIKAVLVELNSETNRVRYFKKEKKTEDAIQVIYDSKKMRACEIMDFSDNFTDCPVYYFTDTNQTLVKEKRFEGILLNADGTQAPKNAINPESSDYIIVHFGYSDLSKIANANRKGLAVYNDEMEQILFLPSHMLEDAGGKYYYSSSKYDIEYYRTAASLKKALGNMMLKMNR